MAQVNLKPTIQKMDLIIQGVGSGGTADEIQFPKAFTPIKNDYRAGQTDLKLPSGFYEAMEMSWQLTGLGDAILQVDNGCGIDGVRVTLKATEKNPIGCGSDKLEVIIRGALKDWDPGTIKKGETNTCTQSLDVVYYHLLRNGKSIFERDDLAQFIKINGNLVE